jgi:putative membrane protein
MKTFFTPRATARALLIGTVGFLGASAASAGTAPLRTPVAARNMLHGFAAMPLATDALRENEKAFLGRAVETSRQQIRLAEVGASQADSTEVRSHALTLAADYRELTDSLEALIRRKGGVAGAPVGGTSENYQKLVGKAGADFDREFVRIAASLSSDVMTLFEKAAADARDADVREFAAQQLPVLRAHRNAVVDLKKSVN